MNKDSVFPKVAINTITYKFKTVCKYLYFWFNKCAPAIDWFFKSPSLSQGFHGLFPKWEKLIIVVTEHRHTPVAN